MHPDPIDDIDDITAGGTGGTGDRAESERPQGAGTGRPPLDGPAAPTRSKTERILSTLRHRPPPARLLSTFSARLAGAVARTHSETERVHSTLRHRPPPARLLSTFSARLAGAVTRTRSGTERLWLTMAGRIDAGTAPWSGGSPKRMGPVQDRSETERLRGTPVDADADATDAGARGAAADGADEIGGTGRTDEADGADAAADAADADPAAFLDMLSWWELSAVHRVTAIADRLDLPLRAYLVLAELARRPPGLSNAQITGIVGLPSATVTTIIGALTADGLVVRHPDRVDRRQVVSDVTELGRARLAAGRPDPGELRELVFDFRPEHLDAVRVFVTRSTSRAYRRSRAQWERRLR